MDQFAPVKDTYPSLNDVTELMSKMALKTDPVVSQSEKSTSPILTEKHPSLDRLPFPVQSRILDHLKNDMPVMEALLPGFAPAKPLAEHRRKLQPSLGAVALIGKLRAMRWYDRDVACSVLKRSAALPPVLHARVMKAFLEYGHRSSDLTRAPIFLRQTLRMQFLQDGIDHAMTLPPEHALKVACDLIDRCIVRGTLAEGERTNYDKLFPFTKAAVRLPHDEQSRLWMKLLEKSNGWDLAEIRRAALRSAEDMAPEYAARIRTAAGA
ncbi:hypothetical protein E4K72_10930 [Oxalobacteraceae bacterium OM1]|nr:hypothetical protein E4K72_10930 [Oxalobacteraceae bacterium OM1]